MFLGSLGLVVWPKLGDLFVSLRWSFCIIIIIIAIVIIIDIYSFKSFSN